MAQWRNWSGKVTCQPQSLAFLRSEDDARALVRQCAAEGERLRIVGAGHSHSHIVATDAVLADVSGLSGVIETDSERRQAWLWAGTPVYALGIELKRRGLALKNQGDIDRQLLGGAIATGTHGTGRSLQNLSASVLALELVLASGDLVACSAATEPDLFEAARLGIGSVGLVTRVQMQLRDAVVLRERAWSSGFDALFDDIPRLVDAHERFEFFWYPHTDEASVKTIDAVDAAPVYPLAPEGSRQAWSHEVLPNHRPNKHTEMEYSVPSERGPACLAELRDMIRRDFPQLRWPIEYRTVEADAVWLSMAFERPTVTISVHEDVRLDEEPYFRAAESIFLAHGGRPHWGKVNYLSGEVLAGLYPRWRDWWRVRDGHDPGGTFLNRWAEGVRPQPP